LLFDRRRQSYFLGRYAAKRALNFLTDEDPAELTIYHGVFDNPVVESNKTPFRFDVSITHSSDVAAAIAFPTAHPMGIDIEQVDQAKAQVVEKELTPYECALFSHTDFGLSHPSMLSMAWTIKESISKVLKTGLMTPFSMYEILSISCNNYVYTSYFKNLSQYKSLSFLINNHVCSITLPKNTNLDISNILTHSSND